MGAIEDYLGAEDTAAPQSAAMAYLDQPDQKTGIEAIPGFVDSNTIKGLTMGAMAPLEVMSTLGTVKNNALRNVSNLIQGKSQRYPMNPMDLYGRATNQVLGAEKQAGIVDRPELQQVQQEHPYAAAALQGIGSAALSPTPMNFARGAAGGIGARVASDEYPNSKFAPILGGLVAGVGPDLLTAGAKGLYGTVAPFFGANQASRADELIQQSAHNPANLGQPFQPPLEGLQLTQGMISNDPGVQALERGIENATPNSQGAVPARAAHNNGIIRSALTSLHSEGDIQNPTTAMADASVRLNDALDSAYTVAHDRETAAWQGLNAPVQIAPLERSVDEMIDGLTKAERKYVPSAVVDIIRNDFNDVEPLNEITSLRSTVRTAARDAQIKGESNQARILNKLDGVILNHIDNLSDSDVGAAQVDQYNAARAISAENAKRFKTGPVSKLFALDSTGADRVAPSATGSLFFKPGAGGTEALQSLATAAGDDPAAIQAAKDYFVAQMLQKGVAGKGDVINPGSLKQFLSGNQHVLESGLFSPEEIDQITRAHQAAEITNRTITSMPRGSPTYPLIQSGNFVKSPITGTAGQVVGGLGGLAAGHLTGVGPFGAALGALKGMDLGSKIYAGPNRNIQQLLYDRLVNPEVPPPAPFSLAPPRQP